MPTLAAEEYMFTSSGLLLNGSANAVPFVDITSIEGLDNAPLRQQTHDMEGQDGGYVDSEFETIRTVTLEGTIYADARNMEQYLDQLKANFAPTTTVQPLYIGTDREQRVVFGKSQGLRYTKDSKRRLGLCDFQVQIICEDPRIYTDSLISQQVTRSTGTLNITLDGNRPSPAIITLTGTISSPTVTYTRTSTTFSFTGYTLNSGQQLVIDLNNRTVIQAGVSKRSAMTITAGKWFLLQPGVNTFTYGGTGGTSTIKVEARSAWR